MAESVSARVSDTVGGGVGEHGSAWKERLGRVGLAGRGVLYGVIGLLALQLAGGAPDEQASSEGALAWIGQQPLGRFLLVGMTIALFALAAWRLLDAWLGDPVEGEEASDRIRFAAKGLVYLVLAVASTSITISNWSGSTASGSASGESGSQQQATAVVLSWPMGQWLVAGAGLAVIAYAVRVFVRHGVQARFVERLSGSPRRVVTFGRFGYGARAVVWAVVGVLLVQASIAHDPEQAGGLSVALAELSEAPWGPLVLAVVALGLFAFGAFCVAEARYRRAA